MEAESPNNNIMQVVTSFQMRESLSNTSDSAPRVVPGPISERNKQ